MTTDTKPKQTRRIFSLPPDLDAFVEMIPSGQRSQVAARALEVFRASPEGQQIEQAAKRYASELAQASGGANE